LLILERADGERRTIKIVRHPGAIDQGDGGVACIGGDGLHLVGKFLGIDLEARARGEHQLRLPGRGVRPASQHHALADQGKEHRQPSQRRHATGTRLFWCAGDRHA
jgi:hypothetical protein